MASTVKFAFVRYLKDNEKDIVPLHYFKNFTPIDSRDLDSTKAYLVQWRGDLASSTGTDDEDVYYKAQILMLGATREELEKKKEASRVRIPKVMDTSVEGSSSEDEHEILQKETAKTRKQTRRDVEAAKQKSLKSIINEKLERKKAAPIFKAANHTVQEMPCQSQDCRVKIHNAKRRYREAEAKNVEIEAEIKRARNDASDYQKLNKELQTELLEALRGKKGENVKRTSTPQPQKTESCNIHIDGVQDTEGPKYIEEDGKISVGAGISLTSHQWKAISSQQKHSLFVKGLAVAAWGTEVLKDRSVEGKICPRLKDKREPRKPLSPEKLKALKDCFEDRLDRQKVNKEEREIETGKFKKYITEKIQDINRLIRKQANQ